MNLCHQRLGLFLLLLDRHHELLLLLFRDLQFLHVPRRPEQQVFLQLQLMQARALAFGEDFLAGRAAFAVHDDIPLLGIAGDVAEVLVVGAEIMSRMLDWKDRTTCVLFGDGAGAVILQATDVPGILAGRLHSDGRHHSLLRVDGSISNGEVQGDPFIRMEGQAVFKFAVTVLSRVVEEVLNEAGLTGSDIDWLVPHQANIRIIDATAKKLGLSLDNVVVTVANHGNTSSASIPLALDAAVRDGRIKSGPHVLLEAIGGGFTWGAVLLKW